MVKIQEKGKVSFFTALADFFKGYFNFRGRTTRAGFWWTGLFLWLSFMFLGLMFSVVQLVLRSLFNIADPSFFNPFLYVTALIVFFILVPVLAMLTRRLFDIGLNEKSVFLWLFGALSVKAAFVLFQVLESPFGVYISFMLGFFFMVAFVLFALLPSDYLLEDEKLSSELLSQEDEKISTELSSSQEDEKLKENTTEQTSEEVKENPNEKLPEESSLAKEDLLEQSSSELVESAEEVELVEQASETVLDEDQKSVFVVSSDKVRGLDARDMVKNISEATKGVTDENLES